MSVCGSVGTFLECVGDGLPLPYKWRGARLCRGCLIRELNPGLSKKRR